MSAVSAKICGLTRPEDVAAAVGAGADALGFVFARSPRRLTVGQAKTLIAQVPSGVMRVGLFLDPSPGEVWRVLDSLTLDLLQFHGEPENDFCGQFELPFLPAVKPESERAVDPATRYPDAAGILYDSHDPTGAGGTGRAFDWSLVRASRLPIWLAGGLTPENVSTAVAVVKPNWVDVSSGIESAPGIKDPAKIKSFVSAAKAFRKPSGL